MTLSISFIIALFIGFIGIFIGSFLNVVVLRLKSKEGGIVDGKSHCFVCDHELSWKDLFPLFSYIFLKGKCRYCKTHISMQYPLVEFATGVLFFLTSYFFLHILGAESIYDFFILGTWLLIDCFLVVLFVYDVKYYELPDKVTLPLVGIAMALIIVQSAITQTSEFLIQDIFLYIASILISIFCIIKIDYQKNFLSKVLTFCIYFIPFILSFLVHTPLIEASMIGSSLAFFFGIQFYLSNGMAMGGGDIRLGLFMGLIFGWKLGLIAIFISYFIGAFVSIGLIIKHKSRNIQIALGPYLCLGTLITLFLGEKLLTWLLY